MLVVFRDSLSSESASQFNSFEFLFKKYTVRKDMEPSVLSCVSCCADIRHMETAEIFAAIDELIYGMGLTVSMGSVVIQGDQF